VLRHGRQSHSHATLHISFVILRTKYAGRCGRGLTSPPTNLLLQALRRPDLRRCALGSAPGVILPGRSRKLQMQCTAARHSSCKAFVAVVI
jgi:hypothetical protein